jgi:hypothetical protein
MFHVALQDAELLTQECVLGHEFAFGSNQLRSGGLDERVCCGFAPSFESNLDFLQDCAKYVPKGDAGVAARIGRAILLKRLQSLVIKADYSPRTT